MKHHRLVACGLIGAVMLIAACSVTSVPSFSIPSVSVPAVPTLGVPTFGIPTIRPPDIGLTLQAGAAPTAAATSPARIPVTGAGEAVRWFIYAVVALIGIILVLIMFARFTRRPPGSDE